MAKGPVLAPSNRRTERVGLGLAVGILSGAFLFVLGIYKDLNYWVLLSVDFALLVVATTAAIFIARRYGLGRLAGVFFGLGAASIVSGFVLLLLFFAGLGGL